MKISFLGTRGIPSWYGGFEGFLEEISVRLVKKGHKVTVYAHSHLFKKKIKSYKGVNIIYIPCLKGKNTSQFSHSFLSTLHVLFCKTDIVFFCNPSNGPFGLFLKIFKKKSIINVDGLEWLRPKWGWLAKKYFKFGVKTSILFFDILVTDAEEMKQYYLNNFKKETTQIAYGENIRFSRKPELILKWNLKSNDYCLIVGRLIPDNNGLLIVEEFLKSRSKKKLVIVGDVLYKDEYASKVKNMCDDRLVFTGYIKNQDELAELYHNSFLYFHGHEFGGTNPAMLKALAFGCAICALDTVFNREMLDDGKYGVFFNKEESSLKNQIEKIEKGEIKVMEYKKKSRDRIKENYTWEKITNQYVDLFESLNI